MRELGAGGFANRVRVGRRKMEKKADGELEQLAAASSGLVRRVDLVVTECQTSGSRSTPRSERTERSWAVTLAFLGTDGAASSHPRMTPEQNTFLRALETFLSAVRSGREGATPHTEAMPDCTKLEMSTGTLAAASRCRLSPRQAQVLEHVLAGHPNKETALKLMISRRTVEHHRAAVMQKTGARSVPELIRIVGRAAGAGS